MTISEAIDMLDNLMPNAYTQEDKVSWLSQIDGLIYNSIISTHEGAEDISFKGYDIETPTCTELLVCAPYDEIYYLWMESRVNYLNGELLKYNNSIARYNDLFQTYNSWYNRNYMPLGKKIKY